MSAVPAAPGSVSRTQPPLAKSAAPQGLPHYAPATPPTADPILFIVQVYLFLYISRAVEFLVPAALRPMLILSLILLAAAALTSRLPGVWKSTICRLLTFFVGWTTLSMVFGVWPGGSFPVVTDIAKTMIFVVI